MSNRLDFSSVAWNFALVENNPIYKSYSSKLTERSKSEIDELSKNIELKELSSEQKEAEAGLKTVFFRDPLTKALVQSALSDESIELLKEKFGGVHKRQDGSYILNGKAENFVSAWYADIAYQRGYLKADADSNGFLTKSELDETRSGYMTHGYFAVFGNSVMLDVSLSTESYIKLGGYSTAYDGHTQVFKEAQKSFYNSGKFAEETIALELDKSIKNDKDLNGILQYNELMSFEEMKQQSMDTTEYEIVVAPNYFKNVFEMSEELSNIYNEVMKELKLFEKLEKEGFDSLSKEEKEYLLAKYPEFFDINQNFLKEKFDEFYEKFKEDFVEKSKNFLDLKDDENLDLSFDELSLVMKEIFSNIASVNISNPFYKKRFVDLEV